MKPSDQIFDSLHFTLKAFSTVSILRLRWIYFLPLLILFITIFTGFALTNDLHSVVMNYLKSLVVQSTSEKGIVSFLFSVSSVVTWIIIKISLFLILGILSGYITLIVLSPVYAWISEKAEENLLNKTYPFRLNKFVKDVIGAITIALRNGFIQLLWTILLLLLSFIPIVNIFTAPALFVITAYFYGFSFLDYSHERRGMALKERIKRVRKLKFSSICLGSVFLLLNMIPWIGSLIAGIMSFNLIIAGTEIVINSDKTDLQTG